MLRPERSPGEGNSSRTLTTKRWLRLPSLVGIPVTIEQTIENQCLDLRLFGRLEFFLVASPVVCALGIHIRGEENVLTIRRPEFTPGFGCDRSQLLYAGDCEIGRAHVGNPDLRTAFFI